MLSHQVNGWIDSLNSETTTFEKQHYKFITKFLDVELRYLQLSRGEIT